MAITDPKHRMKRLHVIPLEEADENYGRKPSLKRAKGTVKKSELTLLEKQGLQALLSLHSDIRPLERQEAEIEQGVITPEKIHSLHHDCPCAAALNLSKHLDAPHYYTKEKPVIRFLGDPLAVPFPPMGRPLAPPPPLPRVAYGHVFSAGKSQRPDKVQS